MNRQLVTLLFLLAAIAFYVSGRAIPAGILMVLGMLAEITFWLRLFKSGKQDSEV